MTERTQLALKLIATHITLPVALLILSFYTNNDAFLFVTITQTLLCILYLAGYWEFFGIRFKYVFCGLNQVALLIILTLKLQSGFNHATNLYIVVAFSMIQSYLLIELIRIFMVIVRKETTALEIEFPFRKGSYLITDGGNSKTSRLMNYHYFSPTHKRNNTNNSMLFATDMVKINNGYPSFLPVANEAYPVYDENIYSPMAGIVVKVVNNITDNKPYAGNYPYNTGNTVVIKKDNYYLLLGHLKMDSIVVSEGDILQANDLIGACGNSGWSERPHLHMQLINSDTDNYWSGYGISIRYKNRNMYKNKILKV